MALSTKSLIFVLLAVSIPLLYRQFAGYNTVKFVSPYYTDYKIVDHFLRNIAKQMDKVGGYIVENLKNGGEQNNKRSAGKQQLNQLVDIIDTINNNSSFEGNIDDEDGDYLRKVKEEEEKVSKIKVIKCPKDGTETRLWNKYQLSQFSKTSIFTSFLGTVYNATSSTKHFSPSPGVSFVIGVDATRSILTGFLDEHTDDIWDFGGGTMYSKIDERAKLFESTYPTVGRLIGYFYDSQGCPTRELLRIKQLLPKSGGLKEEQRKYLSGCSMTWLFREQYGTVGCCKGFPKIYNGSEPNQCYCFDQNGPGADQLSKSMNVLPGCSSEATKCLLTPDNYKPEHYDYADHEFVPITFNG